MSILCGVMVTSPRCTSVVRVSYPSLYSSGRAKGLIEQWDGIRCSVRGQESKLHSEIEDITVVPHISAAWTVGEIGDKSRTRLIDAFDGTHWANVERPRLPSRNGLTSVGASLQADVWVTGMRNDTAGLLMHVDRQQS